MAEDASVFDFAIIGAGIAGASVAWQLAPHASILLLEREVQPGYHATGRSAAMFMETYGTPAIQALTRASRSFYERPPGDFTEHRLLHPRGVLYIASVGQEHELERVWTELSSRANNVSRLSAEDCLRRVPCLQTRSLLGGIAEPDAMDLDVNALYQGFLRGARKHGAALHCNAELTSAQRAQDGVWTLQLHNGQHRRARTIVNAGGAWADEIARQCGVLPAGLVPKRRTAFTFPIPENMDAAQWPAVVGITESFYFKPDAGQLLGSPANADPVAPHDVVAEELDVAIGIHEITQATSLQIRRPSHTWAGLRTFSPDGDFVIGYDRQEEGFFWLAGQGGYGIQTAAAASQVAAALLRHEAVPESIQAFGVDATTFDVARFRPDTP